MPGITGISGLIAGFDTKAAVDELLGFRKFEISQLTKKQDTESAKQTSLAELNTLLSDFRSQSIAMRDVDNFFSYTASLTSNNAAVPANSLLDVAGDNSVTAGNHTVVVEQLAATARVSSSSGVKDSAGTAIAAEDTVLNLTAGSFLLNGTTINVDAADSLKDIEATINNASTGVTASVVKVADSDFRLVLAASETGRTGFSLVGSDLNSGGALANLQLGSIASSAAVTDAASSAVSSDLTALGLSGTFQINGSNVTINVADSLQDIAATITSSVSGVTAAVQNIGSADFRLTLLADTTNPPAGDTITVTDPNLLFGSTLAGLNLTDGESISNSISSLQQAQDANVTIDGLAITRSSNSIGDAISGLTFTLKQADPTTAVNMTIGVDTLDVRDQVQSFVDGYNALSSFINDQFKVDADTGENGVLAGEPILTSIQSSLSSALLQSVSGLGSDRDSMVKIGVEPDRNGVLSINGNLFDNFLNNDPAAIRDLFVAQGSSTTSGMRFLITGDNTASGNYAVDITAVATRASVSGILAALGSDQTITLSEDGNQRQATITQLTTDTQSDLIAKMNTEFAVVSTELRIFDALLTDSTTTSAATGGSDLTDVGGAVGETISISGTNRAGVAVNSSFTLLAGDKVSDLLSAIQSAFSQQVTTSIDANGKINVLDNSTGDSQLSVSLSSDAALSLGTDSDVSSITGRYAMGLEAVVNASGNIDIQHKYYGANNGFSISGASLGLGIADSTSAEVGTDLAGTIGGEEATGKGQVLVGTGTGAAEGIGILYNGIATPPFTANMVIGMGVAAIYDGRIDLFSNPFSGFVQNTISSSEGTFDTLTSRITDLEAQMEQQRVLLTKSFSRMEAALASLQGVGSFLTQQIDAINNSSN
ncbi:MAG: flagellar filament capping protein FliD [Mariprofundaceae bacterium]